MKLEELSLTAIDGVRHLTVSESIVEAVAFAARLGWSDATAYRFVTALVITDNLLNRDQWRPVLRKIRDLQTAADLAALELGHVVTGEVE